MSIKTIAIIGAVIFGIVAAFTFLMAFGLPLGEFSMGGNYKIIPQNMRIICWICFAVQVFAIMIILQTGHIMPLWFSMKITKNICIFFAVYLSINSVMNLLSQSMKEKLFATPFSVAAAICFWIVSLNYNK